MKALYLVSSLLTMACAAQSSAPPPSNPSASGAGNALPSTSGTSSTSSNVAANGAPSAEPAASTTPSSGTPSTETSPPPPAGTKTLPLVAVKSVGMHIGGGPNDAAGKAPFEKAIEQHFPDFLRCYRLVTEPGKSGTFGVDLHIDRGGGKPHVEQPRTGLGNEPFKACMVSAFEGVEFPALKKPSVVSYSLRFTVEP